MKTYIYMTPYIDENADQDEADLQNKHHCSQPTCNLKAILDPTDSTSHVQYCLMIILM